MVEYIRTYSQQLMDHAFDDPQELVSYMGAVQGQDIEMCKWAVGIRLRQPSLSAVREAIDSGRIIRTHILRPTWHLVSAEDIRWMLSLCGEKLRTAYMTSWWKHYEIDEKIYTRFCDAASKLLTETDGLTVQELTEALSETGWTADQVKCMLATGEVEGLFCNGRERDRKHTYALLEERVPAVPSLSREEALALLARKYFRSHTPASQKDFVWWSGLSITEAKAAIASIGTELIPDRYEGEKLYVHDSCAKDGIVCDGVHLIPPYDEYLISYADRTHVLDPKYKSKAHNNFGIFQPVIYSGGKIVGNWKKVKSKSGLGIETTFFSKAMTPGKRKLQAAIDRYLEFMRE